MKIIKAIIIFLFANSLLFSQSLSEVKICIDPGHGGHSSNDRPPVTGSTFWESDGNWYKSQHAKEILTSLGATVIVTRNGNTDADDPALSVRSGIANSNNVDLFHSIHSNATGTSNRVNFALMLYRGYDDAPVFPASKTYAIKAYRNFEKVNHLEDKSWDVVRGDWSFYPSWGTQGLGVLRNLTMPGILSEGSFHDYVPEARRLKNSGYLRHEAWAITRSMLEHFDAGTLPNGNIGGILRDAIENIPSSYQAISSLGDTKKPLNHVKVTLQPGNIVYNGDDENNGYYFFDNISPGSYTLFLEAEDYSLDSANITVLANQSIFVHKNLSLVPNENNPNVVSSYPANNGVEVSNIANIEIQFDVQMDKTTTEAAFSITPEVAGTFSFENNSKTLVFDPTSPLTGGQNYQVNIANTAETIFGKQLVWDYSFQFTTRSKLNMISAYPADGAIDISRSLEVRLEFDQAIKSTTLSGNIKFEDELGNFVSLAVDMAGYAKGFISFVPSSDLILGGNYKVIIGENIGDIEGVTLQENFEINFTVETDNISGGEVVDDFETAGNWNTPQASGSTGIDENSSFEVTSSKKYNGSSSGALKYSFNSEDGAYKISRITPEPIGTAGESMFGLWIKGELSNNILEYWFNDSENNLYSIEVDTLNFTGWKFKAVALSDVATGDLKFEGVGIKYVTSADTAGLIYIDDAQYDFTTPVENEVDNIPSEYSLSQNYPNPFNPSTTIKYSITAHTSLAATQQVSIVVYDILGRKVATVVNKEQKAGNYEVTFNAESLTSGIYFYKLQTGDFAATKKLLLLK
jgi:N-acetylmuramoyl-L-alanine amidase